VIEALVFRFGFRSTLLSQPVRRLRRLRPRPPGAVDGGERSAAQDDPWAGCAPGSTCSHGAQMRSGLRGLRGCACPLVPAMLACAAPATYGERHPMAACPERPKAGGSRRSPGLWSAPKGAGHRRTAAPVGTAVFVGAGDGIRTRDIYLGKVVLYQLSYSRVRVEVRNSRRRPRPHVKITPRADLLSRGTAPQLSSALRCLTSEFGMGSGGSTALRARRAKIRQALRRVERPSSSNHDGDESINGYVLVRLVLVS
jgi:hypothetical protein